VIYLIAPSELLTERVKIGSTVNVLDRLAALNTGSPVLLALLYTFPGSFPEESLTPPKENAVLKLDGLWDDIDFTGIPADDLAEMVSKLSPGPLSANRLMAYMINEYRNSHTFP
jgi:hypothetical protein